MITMVMLAGLGALILAAFSREVPRPEHPRPDFRRDTWLNLNGPWEFQEDPEGIGEASGWTSGTVLAGSIRVPFCPESAPSGIGKTDFMKRVWYRRHFMVGPDMAGRRLLLHFGAVDWHARVWVNGVQVGEHRGGYSQFTLDISMAARPGSNEVVLVAEDDTASGNQATGKQSHRLESYGCVYTRTTGIWQTVWLEAAGPTWVRGLHIEPDLGSGRAVVRGWVDGPQAALVRVAALSDGVEIACETVPAGWRSTLAVLSLGNARAWSPEDPFLYDLLVEVLVDGVVVDRVHSYFGIRSIAIEGKRFLINGRPIYQRLVLDQGFYPDGIYTARSDEELRADIELSMAAGFNGARLHQKVFEPRFLYWADRLGYLVWGEYPSWGLDWGRHEATAWAMDEWRSVVERDWNHPSIIGWCPLNETAGGDGVEASQRLMALTQTMDPSRPFLDASGWVHLYPGTDVYDGHDYDQEPASFAAKLESFRTTGQEPPVQNADPRGQYLGQPYFVSEYGGIKLRTERSTEGGWGYGESGMDEFLAKYRGLTDAQLDNPNTFGFCYTQLTDVEQEQNGIYFYDRSPKYDPALVAEINRRPAAYEQEN